MRYCPTCDAEYEDAIERCNEDGTALLDKAAYQAELRRQGRVPIRVRALVTVGTFGNRFMADEIAQALADERFDVGLVSNKAATVGPLTQPEPATYSIVVPEDERERAAALVAQWRAGLEATQAEAEQQAEVEATNPPAPIP